MDRNDPKSTAAIASLRLLGRHRRDPPRPANRVGWSRLRRHRPDADARLLQDRASSWASTCGSRPRSRRPSRTATTTTSSWRATASTRSCARVLRRVPPRRRQPSVQVHLAQYAPSSTTRSFIFEETEHGWMWIRLPVRHRHGDGDRRVRTADVGCVGLRSTCRRRRRSPRASVFAEHLGRHC